MRHRDAIELLPDFAMGTASGPRAADLRVHVSGCAACQEWLETCRLLAGALGVEPTAADRTGREGHPDEEILALCAVRPEEVFENDRSDILAHLDACPTCRGAVELVEEAVRRARPSRADRHDLTPARRRRLGGRALLVAASLLVTVGIGSLLLGRAMIGSPAPGDAEPRAAAPTVPAAESPSSGESLSDVELEGTHLIESDQAFTVSNVKIATDGRVTFRAHGVVAFSDGFEVRDGGSITVESIGADRGDVGPPRRLN